MAGQIVSFKEVDFGYPGQPALFKNLDFGIDMESRLAMVGANGGAATPVGMIICFGLLNQSLFNMLYFQRLIVIPRSINAQNLKPVWGWLYVLAGFLSL